MKKPVHVVHILPTLAVGGAERAVINLINASDPTRVRYSIIVLFDKRPLEQALLPGRASVFVVQKTSLVGWGLIRRLTQLLGTLAPDVVHTHLFSPDVWGRMAAKKLHLPVVTTEHNINTADGWIKHVMRRMLRSLSDQYVACSRSVGDYVVARYGITQPLSVIPWGIPLDQFRAVAPLLVVPPVRFLILGRLYPQKGQDIALRACAMVKDLPWRMDIVGDGPEREMLCALAKELGVEDRVTFHRSTLDVAQVFGDHDVVLIPSRWEGLGIVAMEAMAAGRLVMASDVDGLREVVVNPEIGILVAPTVEAWAQSIRQVLTEGIEPLRKRAALGQAHAYRHYDIREEVLAYERIYFSLCR